MTSVFDWKSEKRDSIFAADPDFRACGKQKKSHSQLQTEYFARKAREAKKNRDGSPTPADKPKA